MRVRRRRRRWRWWQAQMRTIRTTQEDRILATLLRVLDHLRIRALLTGRGPFMPSTPERVSPWPLHVTECKVARHTELDGVAGAPNEAGLVGSDTHGE